jgi:hypothetical protein
MGWQALSFDQQRSEQTAFWQRLLSFAWPQRRRCTVLNLLTQA